jgi:hypothetical protein
MIYRILPLLPLLAGCSDHPSNMRKLELEEAFFRGATYAVTCQLSNNLVTPGVEVAADQAAREIMDRRGK